MRKPPRQKARSKLADHKQTLRNTTAKRFSPRRRRTIFHKEIVHYSKKQTCSRTRFGQNQGLWRHFSDTMFPGLGGVFQFLQELTCYFTSILLNSEPSLSYYEFVGGTLSRWQLRMKNQAKTWQRYWRQIAVEPDFEVFTNCLQPFGDFVRHSI